MGRYLPTVCQHGIEVDAGDFGPCQNCDDHGDDPCPNFKACHQCDAIRRREEMAREIGEIILSSTDELDCVCGRHWIRVPFAGWVED